MEGNPLTAGYFYINSRDKKGHYARAGHEPLLHVSRRNGAVALDEYMPQGRVIGVDDSMEPELAEFEIDNGDRIVAYTDGLVEAVNVNREMFGLDRLKSLIIESAGFSIDDAVEYIFRKLQQWRSSVQFDDDFTLIMIDIV